jgi:hypothetical protein
MGVNADTELWRRVTTSALTQVMEGICVRLVPSNYQIPLGPRTCGSQVMPDPRHSLTCKFGNVSSNRSNDQMIIPAYNQPARQFGWLCSYEHSDSASRHGTRGCRYIHARRTMLFCMRLSSDKFVDNIFAPPSRIGEIGLIVTFATYDMHGATETTRRSFTLVSHGHVEFLDFPVLDRQPSFRDEGGSW